MVMLRNRVILLLGVGCLVLAAEVDCAHGESRQMNAAYGTPIATPTHRPLVTSSPIPSADPVDGGTVFIDQAGLEKHRDFLIQHYAEQGTQYDPGEIGEEEQLSPADWERRYGPRVEYHEEPPGEKVTGCLYTVGASKPDVCFADNGEEIYNEQRDDVTVFEELKKRQQLRFGMATPGAPTPLSK